MYFLLTSLGGKKRVTRCFHASTRTALKSIASRMKPKFERTPTKAVVFCKKMANRIEEEEKEEELTSIKEEIMKMVVDLVKNQKQFRVRIANKSEASFTEKYLMPAIRRGLLQDTSKDLLYAIIDKPNQDGKRPDVMIGTKVKNKDVYFFYVEIKRPETTDKYQPEDDYAKLLKLMKASIDEQLCLGVENPASLGLLVEGFECALFKMVVLSDGLYLPMSIERFSLVDHNHHLVLIPSVVEALCFVKCELGNFVAEMNEKKTTNEQKETWKRPCACLICDESRNKGGSQEEDYQIE